MYISNHMKKTAVILLAMTTLLGSCGSKSETNPLLADFDTPFGVPPFDKIKTEHYIPAFEQAIIEARAEVEAIANSKEEPTFENTIAAMERSGTRLTAISNIFFNLNEAETNDSMQQIALEISPKLTEFGNDIQLNPALYERVKKVYDKKDGLGLTEEQTKLLEKTYKGFVRNGAALNEQDKAKYREISNELSQLSLQFGQNALAATNAFKLVLTDSADLAGLPAMIVETAAEEAKADSSEGWVFTLQAPSMIPFLQYSDKRDLREKVWKAYNQRSVGGQYDNTTIVKRLADLRLQMANLLGYPSYADYVLEERMAGSSQKVNEFLDELLTRSMPYAKKDYDMINSYAKSQGLPGNVMPWDWSYYTEKYKAEHYKIDNEMTRPYFKLENIQKGIFLLAGKLYGLEFKENKELPIYHPDVKAFEVYDKDKSLLAILYIDYFPRTSKRGGAWMTSFRDQYTENGKDVRPIVSLVCNFTKPTSTTPSLLTFDEAETILHEFGHALHGMLAKGNYSSVTGTAVYRDFVELPSQIMENWMSEKEYLDLWAEHYQTGEKIPQELVEKIVASKNYLSGYLNSRQLSFGITDMAWHSITAPVTEDLATFERKAMDKARVQPFVEGTAFSPSFSHIFAGGYAAGYYGYKWAEVLDADAFAAFKEKGIFNQEVAQSFRDNILSKGGSADPMELYVKFRGHEPTMDAFFERSGLTKN